MGRSPCCEKDGLKRGPWTPEEDQKLIDYINKNGYGNWRTLPKNAGLFSCCFLCVSAKISSFFYANNIGLHRCGKSCRLRWTNYLRPDIKRGRFSFEEEETIIQLHRLLGNKWSAIAARIPGRTDNEIKNYWNTHIRKRLLRMGIDPVTHSPRLDLLDLSTILRTSSNLYDNSTPQMNFSRLLGLHPLINPQLIRLATSLLSSQRQTHEFLIPTASPISYSSQMQTPVQDLQNPNPCLDSTPSAALFDQNHSYQFTQNGDFEQIPHILSGFRPTQEIQEFNQWQHNNGISTNLTEDYVPLMNYGCNVSDQHVMDPINSSSDTPTFQYSNNSSNEFGFQSVLSNISTPSSSPAPLHSSSNYIYTTSSTDQDHDRTESCSDILQFEISDIFNDFM
ncbi:hypothetical protein F511_12790 [Dorcoceras hygrometricum]|uniref:Uncharacterized protein n=1 Tax=Dorcoceras hygrometricum TaxID=472368 RepID=A0A2Z7D6S5_9LAMI|nr:hypothetical protein F511_12790 [Dorcoceras hygrometricum]